MKIVIAPDSFKGSLSSSRAAVAIDRGLRSIVPTIETVLLPLADGGEGTVDAVLDSHPGERISLPVKDPIGRTVEAEYAWYAKERLAVVEMAQASGLPLLNEEELDPVRASTYGTGELLVNALDRGAHTIVLGLGGSATVDGGMGCLQALGVEFFGEDGPFDWYSGPLSSVKSYRTDHIHPGLKDVAVILASDVTNPLLGDKGAITIFGPQKGVRSADILDLENGMQHWARLLFESEWEHEARKSGMGAAGGIGFALSRFCSCQTRSGFDFVADFVGLEKHLKTADLLITGEGSMDSQSFFGKVPTAAAALAASKKTSTVAFAGRIDGALKDFADVGIAVTIPIVDGVMSLAHAMDHAEILLERAAARFMQGMQLGQVLAKGVRPSD